MATPRRGRIVILGLPYFGRMLEGLLRGRGWDARFVAHPGRSPRGWLALAPLVARADIIYLIGSRIDRNCPQDILMRLRRRPVVIHWVGTDVLIATEEHAKGNVSKRIARRAVHWCDASWLVDELRAFGVRAAHVPLPIPGLATGDPPPLPDRFRALLYLPVDAFDREVFDQATLLRLPLEFPGIEFTLIPSPRETLPVPVPANLTARGWVDDIDALYREMTAVVRLTSHDGMSFMALEALSRGRYVIWTHPLPGAIQASGFDAVVAALRGLVERHEAGQLSLNTTGQESVLHEFDFERLLADLDQRLAALPRRRTRSRAR